MISSNLGLVVALACLAGSHEHGKPVPARCDDCGTSIGPILREIEILRTSPSKGDREDAAEDLRKLDWRCHPEAVLALCDALAFDPSDDVREEAAESLRKMGACVPAAHEALRRAASSDPDHGVRKEARESLKSLGRRCIADCRACGPGPVIRDPEGIPPDWLPLLAPGPGTTSAPIPSPAPIPTSVTAPAARPDLLRPIEPGPSTLSDTPPPPPVPATLGGPLGVRPQGDRSARRR